MHSALTRWTDGHVLVATGSPFPPLELDDKRVAVAQSNNVFILPARRLGVIAARARRVADGMLDAAARPPRGTLPPPTTDTRRCSLTARWTPHYDGHPTSNRSCTL